MMSGQKLLDIAAMATRKELYTVGAQIGSSLATTSLKLSIRLSLKVHWLEWTYSMATQFIKVLSLRKNLLSVMSLKVKQVAF